MEGCNKRPPTEGKMSGSAGSAPFYRDQRGNRLEDWTTTSVGSGHVLWLRGPVEVVQQVTALAPEYRRLPDSVTAGPTWTHALQSPRPDAPELVRGLLGLLTEVVCLPSPPNVDFALALDWYKKPEEGVDPFDWDNTPTAQLVSSGKYRYKNNDDMQSRVGLQLVNLMCRAIERHGILTQATVILDIPGHDSSRVSFGSRMASTIARRRDIPIIKVAAKSAFRPEAKNLEESERLNFLNDQFSVRQSLTGQRVLIADDVFRSGTSMGAVASAARDVGAVNVYGICGVRTMRR
jgi:pyrimidine operon attenuation protein/uracil phosphoribosyltransferase